MTSFPLTTKTIAMKKSNTPKTLSLCQLVSDTTVYKSLCLYTSPRLIPKGTPCVFLRPEEGIFTERAEVLFEGMDGVWLVALNQLEHISAPVINFKHKSGRYHLDLNHGLNFRKLKWMLLPFQLEQFFFRHGIPLEGNRELAEDELTKLFLAAERMGYSLAAFIKATVIDLEPAAINTSFRSNEDLYEAYCAFMVGFNGSDKHSINN